MNRADMIAAPDVEVICSKCNRPFMVKYRTAYDRQNKEWDYVCKSCEAMESHINHPKLNKNPTHISVKCCMCNNDFTKTYIAYCRNLKFGINHVCKECLPEYISNRRLYEWNNMSEEDKFYVVKRLHDGNDIYWSSLTEEDRLAISKLRSKISKNRIQNMSIDEYTEMMYNINEGHKRWRDSMSPDEFIAWNKKRIESVKHNIKHLNKTESKVLYDMNIVKSSNTTITPRWYNKTVHDEFKYRFPYNPHLKTYNIIPFHEWDFMVRFKNNNVLIDVDGSIHNPLNAIMIHSIDVSSYIQFNDSKRPYQTDGLDWYVIQCYDDKLSGDTKVFVGKTNEMITYKDLLNILGGETIDSQD